MHHLVKCPNETFVIKRAALAVTPDPPGFNVVDCRSSHRLPPVKHPLWITPEAMMAGCVATSDAFRSNSVFKALFKGLDEQRRDGTFCDVILKINGRKVAAHSCVLAIFSPWMMSTLSRIRPWPFISSDDPEEIDLDLSGSDEMFQALEIVVGYLYTGKMDISHENVDDVQRVATNLNVPMVASRCRSWKHRHGHQSRSASKKSERMSTEFSNDEVKEEEDTTSEDPSSVSPSQTGLPSTSQQEVIPRRSNRRKNTPVKTIPRPLEEFTSDGSVDDDNGDDDDIWDADVPDMMAESTPRRSTRRKNTPVKSEYKANNDMASDGSEMNNGEADNCGIVVATPAPPAVQRKPRKERYTCCKCTFKARTSLELQEHRRSHWGKFYRCNSCSFLAKKAAKLLDHLAEANHDCVVCSLCNFEAPNSDELKVHLKRHEDRKPFWCDTCDMRFKTKTDLALHMPKHSSETPFVCEVCSKGFKWKGALQSHMVVHAETKQFLCEECGFRTAHKSYMEAHRLLHTGNAYKCLTPGCTFQTIRKQNLKHHMLTHTKEKKYICETCGQAFTLSQHLRRHAKIHSTDSSSQLKCELCPFTTTRTDKLKEHSRKHHNLEVTIAPQRHRMPPQDLTVAHDAQMHQVAIGVPPLPEMVMQPSMHQQQQIQQQQQQQHMHQQQHHSPPTNDMEVEDAVYTIHPLQQ